MSFGSKARPEHAPGEPTLSEAPYYDLLNMEAADVAEEHMGETPRLSSSDQIQIDLTSIRASSAARNRMLEESPLQYGGTPEKYEPTERLGLPA